MSRIGRMPIPLPSGVEVTQDGPSLRVKGPLGVLERRIHPDMKLEREDGDAGRVFRARGTAARTIFMQNVGTIVGKTFEATMEAHWFSGPKFRWNSTLVADRSRGTIEQYNREACPEGITIYCKGVTFGEMSMRVIVLADL